MLIETKEVPLKKALLIGVYRTRKDKVICEEHLKELERLCHTFGFEVDAHIPCPIKKIDAATYLGSGKVDELANIATEKGTEIFIFDEDLSPHHQRNLERLLKKPVMDRTELIIEVFAQRAQTKEARLQIELARQRYQAPRLKRMWTHLSRQAGTGNSGGGGAYLKGEGEKQIEIDRRLLQRRVDQLKEDIEKIHDERAVQRAHRLRTGIPTFAIVGYTNSGKSTLLNALTEAGVLAEDKLFATLDTTTRKYNLPNNQEILLIDTVGFIRKIPHTLVAAFKSTLEEAVHTDILLHLIDVSASSAESQAESTYQVLKELNAAEHPIITVFNKVDACADEELVNRLQQTYPKNVKVSALKKEGFAELLNLMIQEVSRLRKQLKLRIPQSRYELVSELLEEGRIISKQYEENDILLHVEIPHYLEHKVSPFIHDFA
jgi:GTP-binding protein HflX